MEEYKPLSEFVFLQTNRFNNWEQAKGHLKALLQCYRSSMDTSKYDKASKEIKEFIKNIEENGIIE